MIALKHFPRKLKKPKRKWQMSLKFKDSNSFKDFRGSVSSTSKRIGFKACFEFSVVLTFYLCVNLQSTLFMA